LSTNFLKKITGKEAKKDPGSGGRISFSKVCIFSRINYNLLSAKTCSATTTASILQAQQTGSRINTGFPLFFAHSNSTIINFYSLQTPFLCYIKI